MGTRTRVVIAPGGEQSSRIAAPRVVEAVLPDPGPWQVLVRQAASGVCHSQLHQLATPRPRPMALGHESIGTVVAAGSRVTSVAEGDQALVTWLPRRTGDSDRKPEPVQIALSAQEQVVSDVFTWADHTLVDEAYTVKAPTATVTGAVIGCAVMTGAGAVCETAGVRAGDAVAVIGVGGVGVSAVAAAAIVGATPIIAIDVDDEKLAFARRFGATHTVNSARVDPVRAVRGLLPGPSGYPDHAGVDHAIDCVGSAETLPTAVELARPGIPGWSPGGTAVLVGVPRTPIELNAREIQLGEKRLFGSYGGSARPEVTLPRYLDWHTSGRLNLDAMVTRRYELAEVATAVEDLAAGRVLGRSILTMSER